MSEQDDDGSGATCAICGERFTQTEASDHDASKKTNLTNQQAPEQSRGDADSKSDETAPYRLPIERLLTTDDPWQDAIFPAGNRRDPLWREATLQAEKELHELESRLMEASLLTYQTEPRDVGAQIRGFHRWMFDS
jgi:hypothetical protein